MIICLQVNFVLCRYYYTHGISVHVLGPSLLNNFSLPLTQRGTKINAGIFVFNSEFLRKYFFLIMFLCGWKLIYSLCDKNLEIRNPSSNIYFEINVLLRISVLKFFVLVITWILAKQNALFIRKYVNIVFFIHFSDGLK